MKNIHNQDLFPNEVLTRIPEWMQACQRIIDADWTRSKMTHSPPPVIKFRIGKRFVIVTRHNWENGILQESGSAHAFIDITGGKIGGKTHLPGDVLMPATWRAPAKHARGNLFDVEGGTGCMGPYGPAYLK